MTSCHSTQIFLFSIFATFSVWCHIKMEEGESGGGRIVSCWPLPPTTTVAAAAEEFEIALCYMNIIHQNCHPPKLLKHESEIFHFFFSSSFHPFVDRFEMSWRGLLIKWKKSSEKKRVELHCNIEGAEMCVAIVVVLRGKWQPLMSS